MRVDEINEALAGGHLERVEDAFRALLDYPYDALITGAAQSDFSPLMRRVCEALIHDTSNLPSGTAEVAAEFVTGEKREVADYASAARLVLDNFESWEGRL